MKSSNQIKVERIDIRIGDKKLSLTPDEMKELKDILNATFPETVRYYPYAPVVIPRPIYIDGEATCPWKRWDITWASGITDQTMCLTAI